MSHIANETGIDTATGTDAAQQQLTAADRCDSCGAQAYIRVTINNGELFFCAHHGRKYQEKLSSIAHTWHDESSRLFEEQRA
ncbi:DUF7455 domain-containing protein [Okibacterium fritillariae]|uniref:DUF7455 domain-containing protein n=1 Tax=Okibacterium fritillariae TaxID=123320 RepID=A0A1T5JFR2_9MICO|nr:hypothetical protein [Okibacterium fritillariae]SKC49998.1 hypothetical protein SAMN06309945_1481 [Okibacterium fritillariae]